MSERSGVTRRNLLRAGGACVGGAAVLGAVGCGHKSHPAARDANGPGDQVARNAIVIITDSTRADHLGVYGNKLGLTPNLDALARDELTFDRAHAEAMPTVPVRRAVLTGERSYPFRNWQVEELLPQQPGWTSIPDYQDTFLNLLGGAGYTTAYATDNPFLIGPRFKRLRSQVDHVVSFIGQAADYSGRPYTTVPDEDISPYLIPALRKSPQKRALGQYLKYNPPSRSEDDHLAARVFKAGMKLVDRLRYDQPFVLVIDAFDPHEPWDPPARWRRRFAGATALDPEPIQPFQTPFGNVKDLGLSEEILRRIRGLYSAEVAFVDHWIGNFMAKVDDAGLLDSTAVFYLSDHGILLGERGWIGKTGSQLHREIYHTPFILRHPDRKRAGDRSSYFASTNDVGPTILSWLGERVPGRMDGEDLSVIFGDGEPPERRYATACYESHFMCNDGRWYLLADSDGRHPALYDTRTDAEELHDVAKDNPDVVDRLWKAIVDAAGGTLPRFGPKGVLAD